MSFIYLIQMSICLTVFYGLYYFFFRKETFSQLNRIYLLSSLVVALLIPVMPQFVTVSASEVPQWVADAPKITTVTKTFSTVPTSVISTDVAANRAKAEGFTFKLGHWLGWIYLLGVCFFGAKLLFFLLKIGWQVNHFPVERKDGYFLVKSQQPAICSFFNYVFWNDDLHFSQKEKHQIIEHELAHVKEGHTFDVLFLEILTIIFWFHPLIYLYKKSLKAVHEYIADHFVFYDLNYKSDYAQLIVKEVKSQQVLQSMPVVNTFFNSLTKNRLVMLNQTTRPVRRLKLLAALPILSCLIIAFGLQIEAVAQANEDFQAMIEEVVAPLENAMEVPPNVETHREATSEEVLVNEEDKVVQEAKYIDTLKQPVVNSRYPYMDIKQKVDPKLIAKIEAGGNPFFQPYSKNVVLVVLTEYSRDPVIFREDNSTRTIAEIKKAKVEEQKAKGKNITTEDVMICTDKHVDESFDVLNGQFLGVKEFFRGGMRLDWTGIQNGKLNDLSLPEHHDFQLYDYKTKQFVTVERFSVGFERDGKIHYFENLEVPVGKNKFPPNVFEKLKKVKSGDIVHLFDFKYKVNGDYYLFRDDLTFEIK